MKDTRMWLLAFIAAVSLPAFAVPGDAVPRLQP